MGVGNIYEAKINVNGPEGCWSISQGYKMAAGSVLPSTLEALAEAIIPLFDPNFLNNLTSSHTVESIEVRQVDTGNDIPGTVAFPAGGGNVQEEALPNTAPVMFLWKTVAPNAKYNGKTYVSGVPKTYVLNGIVTASAEPFFLAWAQGMLASVQLTGDENGLFVPVIISRTEDKVKRPEPVGFQIEQVSVNQAVKNQVRRRTQSRGVPAVRP